MTTDQLDITRVARTPSIEVRNLTKSFLREGGNSIRPVDNVSLRVEENELVVLLGPSGCGKTTLLRCVAGLERPDEGEILIDGKTVFSSEKGIFVPPDQRPLSMVFQSFALWPHMTIADNVAYPLRSEKIAKPEIRERVGAVLNMVGVSGLEQQYPGRISGGQQQRVALARALVAGSKVVLFDEPLSNVDAQVRAELRFELKRMQQKLRFSGLYVTHDQTEAMELAHRVAVLQSGRIAALGSPREVYDNPPSEYVANFIGVANIWQGEVVATGEATTVRTDFGTLEMAACGASDIENLQAGAPVRIMVRPEKLRLTSSTPSDTRNVVEVTVEAAMFSGAHTEITVRCGMRDIRVWYQDQGDVEAFAPGSKAWLHIPPRNLRLVAPADETAR